MKLIPTFRNNLTSLGKQLNKVFSSFAMNPVSWTETVLNKLCLSLYIESFLCRRRSWKISKNKNYKANSGAFSQQWILPQPLLLLTSVGFRLQYSSLLPAQIKSQKGEEENQIVFSPQLFSYFLKNPYPGLEQKVKLSPVAAHRNNSLQSLSQHQ